MGQFSFDSKADAPDKESTKSNDDYNYSPRSSIVYVPESTPSNPDSQAQSLSDSQTDIQHESEHKEPYADSQLQDYKGFHGSSRQGTSIPPFSHPIKPRFRKKGASLLGKLIYTNRKDSDPNSDPTAPQEAPEHQEAPEVNDQNELVEGSEPRHPSVSSGTGTNRKSVSSSHSSNSSNRFKFRLSSLTFDHPGSHRNSTASTSSTKSRTSSGDNNSSGKSPNKKRVPTFDLDMDLNDLDGIIKTPPSDTNEGTDYLKPSASSTAISPLRKSQSSVSVASRGGGWKAPDSWDVKATTFETPKDTLEGSESDSDSNSTFNNSTSQSIQNLPSSPESPSNKMNNWNKSSFSSEGSRELPDISKAIGLPVLYGSKNASHVVTDKGIPEKYIIRVFKEDNTFTTIQYYLETTTTELLSYVQRKFFYEDTQNYQLSVHIGNNVKILEPFERPLKIQLGVLMLSGYTDKENLPKIGSEDLSYLCKFVVETVYLRNLTHEEETTLSKDYVNVDISGLNLKNIPIIFHQHTYEIESLNVADNPSIYIPLDFIQSCNYLTSITFSRNGCSKFPSNFLEATTLTHLDMEKNFLDELPTKISHLKNLKHLKLNSNQLTSLPKSFSKLTNLEVLNLSSNYFNSYPDPINDLVNLTDLDLSYNDLSVLPKNMAKLKKLVKLNLCTNKLQKKMPDFFGELISLKRLDIRYNYITNIDILGSLPNLEAVYASKNFISTFSDKIESFRLLHFDRNPVTSLEFNNVLSKLTVLDLSKAKLTIIPANFFDKIANVEKLVLDKNHLGAIPDNLGSLHKLSYLSLFGNNLQSFPSSVGNLVSLQYLDLHSNNLQTLPEEIWNLKSLGFLNVCSNLLTSFPKPPLHIAKRISSATNLPKKSTEDALMRKPSNSAFSSTSLIDSLLVLALADNRLTDEVFNSLAFLTKLKSLNLSYNDIIEIPDGAIRRLSKLTEFYVSGNELTSLPSDDLEHLKNLRLLFLNNNKLVSLPAELSKLTNLLHLDVGSNQLKYNISNWPYDWNWHWNKNLKYLNFSGNKRFEIKQSHTKNPDTDEDFDSLLVLKNLKVLGLIDVTLTTSAVPDQSTEMRIRTTASELDNIGYGVSDSMGIREAVSSRDIFIQKFRGNENEILFACFDGKGGPQSRGHRISAICKNVLASIFADELSKLKANEEVTDALRRTFLALNKEINGALAAMKAGTFNSNAVITSELANLTLAEDGKAGCSITVLYIKDSKLYTANIGDIEALLSRSNGEHVLLTTKHDPTNRSEFERIRAAGGYVSGDGTLDGDLFVSRAAGFFNYLPHLSSNPDIKVLELTEADTMIVLASKVFWDYIPYELAVDIIRSDKDDPMLAAQKLRDFAISYGATDKIVVMVIGLGDQKQNNKNGLYNNLGRENVIFSNKKRRDRAQGAGDTALRMLDDEIEPPVGELAIIFTDIKNSTLLWDAYPVAMRSAIKIHNSIMRRQLRIVGGYEVKTEGDAFVVSFPSPTSALLWCFNVQQQLLTADWPVEILETDQCFEVTDNQGNVIYRGLSVRMGMHWGSPVCELDVVTRRMDYFGPMVNRASRISALADGGQIFISSDFLDEIETLFDLHKKVVSKELTLSEAYQGNVLAGQIIEKEVTQLEQVGVKYFELGEKKLKGLEAPEYVTLAYPDNLAMRFEIFKKQQSTTEIRGGSRFLGAIPIESVYGLRTISLRLENILFTLSGSPFTNQFQEASSSQLLAKSSVLFQDEELLGLLNHVVIRIENCVAMLGLRQELGQLKGDNNWRMNVSTDDLVTELKDIIQQFAKLQRN